MPAGRRGRGRSSSLGDLRSGKDPMALNLSFCGCGFLGMYHLGVASCFLKHGQTMLGQVQRIGGASAGALTAAVLVTAQDKLQESIDLTFGLAKEMRSKPLGFLTPKYNLLKNVRKFLDKHLPPNAHELASGKLYISLTDARTKKNVLIHEFESREELIDALIASSHIPVYAGMKAPRVHGRRYMDGGLSNNQPKFRDGRTVTVSPFAGCQDICPQDAKGKGMFMTHNHMDFQVNFNNMRRFAHALFPPPTGIMQMYFEKGERDAGRFLLREGRYELQPPNLPKGKKCVTLYESSV